ncbi:MAG: tRNA pseudouridine(38-40) synthase TruA [Rhodospirillaceae bacterium]|jgi:tRNA pseudouridine38-40 synthase|nr:tRNA pseudouridine(38-40) synthase TruA [Rhodospirillaceae bacterium]
MQRYKLKIEYDGSGFVGWQRQKNGLGVQQCMEEAVANFCGEQVTIFAAGRTDTGVHALGQVAHIDIEKATTADKVRDALNHHLKDVAISVLSAEAVDNDFHARFSALQRAYVYRIIARRSPLTIERGRAWWVPVKLDAETMHEASQILLGKHDFSTFRAANCQSDSPLKTLDDIRVESEDEEIRIHARARSFLYHQVRNFAGSLKYVGEGRWTVAEFKTAFEAADRTKGGPTAPPEGLYFTEVIY